MPFNLSSVIGGIGAGLGAFQQAGGGGFGAITSSLGAFARALGPGSPQGPSDLMRNTMSGLAQQTLAGAGAGVFDFGMKGATSSIVPQSQLREALLGRLRGGLSTQVGQTGYELTGTLDVTKTGSALALAGGGASASAQATALRRQYMVQARANVPGITERAIHRLVKRFGPNAIANFVGLAVEAILYLFFQSEKHGSRRHRRGISYRQLANARRVYGTVTRMYHQYMPRARAHYAHKPVYAFQRRRRRK